MDKTYQNISNKKILISCISISSLIFINSWIRLNVFNINNNYPLNGYDLGLIFVIFFAFLMLVTINYSIILYLKKKEFLYVLFLSLLLILAINSMRSSINMDFISLKNTRIQIFFLLIITIILFTIKKNKNLIINFFVKFGLITFPFFLIIIFKIIINLFLLNPYDSQLTHKLLINNDNYLIKEKTEKNKIIWLIFDQLDSRYFTNDVLKKHQLDNFYKLISKSNYYKEYTPVTEETTKEIPSILSEKFFSDYRYSIKDNKVRLEFKEKNLNDYKLWNVNETIFNKVKNKDLKIYINGWYHPYCSLFKEFYSKCFQSLYGYFTTLQFRGFVRTFLYQFISIVPAYETLIKNFKINELKIFTQDGSEFLESKINFSKSRLNFINILKENDLDFYFFHSSVPHEPFIYNSNSKKLINDFYREKSSYIDNLKLTDIFLGEVINSLKDNNIYDSSIIIVQGDTGIGKDYINSTLKDRIGSTPLIIKNKYQNKKNIIHDRLYSNDLYKKISEIY
ncbi:sulfatase-like hydrolase/transferase [Candidatus Pelagibacter bacterium nBUS_25]|uniref:sulfatase-like hydrolase/transferase n=1 Tax=Candidatus Pelagibacter bacterium nBUS_25 TaxID=3374187 RepID=UPI003EBEE3F8